MSYEVFLSGEKLVSSYPEPKSWLNPLGFKALPFGNLSALIRLRWIALIGELCVLLVTVSEWDLKLPITPILLILIAQAVSNLTLHRAESKPFKAVAGQVLLFDTGLLTGLLLLTGGPANPFTILYLILVMIAAIMSSRAYTWGVITLSGFGFLLLFSGLAVPLPAELGGHAHADGSFSMHLQGMWLAYVVAAVSLGVFVSELSAALETQRRRQEQSSRLLGLAALAAGAAHEIGNPLGTIRIAAGELSRRLEAHGADPLLLDDVRLIEEETLRAKEVLNQMSISAGELQGEPLVEVGPETVFSELAREARKSRAGVLLDLPDALPSVRWPLRAVSQALSGLIHNAISVTAAGGTVKLRVWQRGSGLSIRIQDQGPGMPEAVLTRLGEPFFTTREGMGLGVFVAHTLIDRLGGNLSFHSQEGYGTTVDVWLPLEAGR